MIRLNDFREIADGIMDDIKVTESLKNRTLARCSKKMNTSAYRFIATAASLVLIFSLARLTGMIPGGNNQTVPQDSSGIKIMLASPENSQESAGKIPDELLEEAEKAFGSGFMVPSFIPDDFVLEGITFPKEHADSITLRYVSLNSQFEITMLKTEESLGLPGYEPVQINNATGYIKSTPIKGKEIPNTELFWFLNGVRYEITGSITSQEAVEIANSMK